MKWLKKIRVFKRLREQEELIRELKAPLFSIRGNELKVWEGSLPTFEKINLLEKIKFAEELIEKGTGLSDLLLTLVTSKGIFRKMLYYHGDQKIDVFEDSLTARVEWPPIEVGNEAVIHRGIISFRGKLMKEIPEFVNMSVRRGDTLKVKYTFRTP